MSSARELTRFLCGCCSLPPPTYPKEVCTADVARGTQEGLAATTTTEPSRAEARTHAVPCLCTISVFTEDLERV